MGKLTIVATEIGGKKEQLAMSVEVDSKGLNLSFSGESGSSEGFAAQNALPQLERRIGSYIQELSSVSLGCNWEGRKERCGVRFVCSMCGKRKDLGMTSGAMVRMKFSEKETVLCERCCNILADVMWNGPRVLAEAFSWELQSKFLRASVVHEELVCGQCLQKRASHMFVKLRVRERSGYSHKVRDIALRRCSVCVYSYVDSMKVMGVWREKFPCTW